MKLIVGLGNPGSKYQNTRHNFGQILIETIALKNQVSFSKKTKLKASIASFQWDDTPVVLAYPETYMNLSGQAVEALVSYHSLSIENDLLIVIDDYAIPFGQIRLRPQGSDGGHNGLKSIDTSIGTQSYARLRLGIGPEEDSQDAPAMPLERYVLAKFKAAEQNSLTEILERGYEACHRWLTGPIEQAMSAVNSGQ